MDQEIKIVAEVDRENASVCKFTVDRPIYAGRRVFENADQAKGVPLAEKLFAVGRIRAISLFGPVVIATREEQANWREIGRAIGTAIREYLHAGLGPTAAQLQAALPETESTRKKLAELIQYQINPNVASHGGFIELIDYKDNNVYLRMGGGCQGCGMANVTLKQGIEALIREKIPEVWQVLDVTDHAGGANPYYEPAK